MNPNPSTTKVASATEKVINKTVSTGKSILSMMVEPIKAKYVKTKINRDFEIFHYKGNKVVSDGYEIRQIVFFKRIFNNKYGKIKFVDNNYYLNFPNNGVYFKRIDKYTVVICIIHETYLGENTTGELKKSNDLYQTIEYKFIGLNAQKVCNRLETFSKDHQLSLNRRIYEMSTQDYIRLYNNFSFVDAIRNIKSFNDVILKDEVKNEIIDILYKYKKNESLYKKYKLRHNIGILLHGPTGTGKSTLAYSIALYLKYPLVVVSPEFIYNYSIGKRALLSLGDSDKRVVLIEEIDTMMDNLSVDKDGDEGGNGVLRRDHILKFIDALPNNTVLVANTNYYEKLDPALIRSGRFDIRLCIDRFEYKEAVKMAKYYNIEPDFIDTYKDKMPICPSELEFYLIQEATKKILNKED